jgi:hypothetical protein
MPILQASDGVTYLIVKVSVLILVLLLWWFTTPHPIAKH